MSDAPEDLKTALQDVRAAYRFLYAYHKRIRGVISTIEDEFLLHENFKELQFWEWSPNLWSKPSRKLIPSNWTWDYFPFHTYSIWYSNMGKNYIPSYKDAMLQISIQTDTALFDSSGEFESDRDPSGFDNVENNTSKSKLTVYVTLCNDPENKETWNSIYDEDNFTGVEVGGKFIQIEREIDLHELSTESQVKKFCKTFLKTPVKWLER